MTIHTVFTVGFENHTAITICPIRSVHIDRIPRLTKAFIAGRMCPTGKGIIYLGELMKTPKEILEGIENDILLEKDKISDLLWLINRVKRLEAALEWYKNANYGGAVWESGSDEMKQGHEVAAEALHESKTK